MRHCPGHNPRTAESIVGLLSNVLQRNTFLSYSVVLELASGASESCYLTVQEFRVVVLNLAFDFDEESMLVKFVFCNDVNFISAEDVGQSAGEGICGKG